MKEKQHLRAVFLFVLLSSVSKDGRVSDRSRKEAKIMKKTIIAIDDTPYWLDRMKKELAQLGYDVISFEKPREARDFFEEHEGDIVLVVSDNQMNLGGRIAPNRGIELLTEMRLVSLREEKIPLILFTSEASSHQRQRVKELDGAVVIKDHSIEGALLAAAKELLGL